MTVSAVLLSRSVSMSFPLIERNAEAFAERLHDRAVGQAAAVFPFRNRFAGDAQLLGKFFLRDAELPSFEGDIAPRDACVHVHLLVRLR